MSDKETDANQDATHIATDDELSQVADEAMAEDVVEEVTETEEEVETEEVVEEATEEVETEEEVVEEDAEKEVVEEAVEDPEEPEDQASRSKLGRKVKKLETLLEAASNRIDSLTSGKGAVAEETDEDDVDPDDYIKASDIPKILAKEKAKETEQRSAYESTYLTKVLEIGKTDEVEDDLQDEIFEEMQKNFNSIETGTPGTDATINFYKAQAAVMARKVAPAKENPLKGGKPKGAIGVGGGADNKVKKAVKAVKLDSEAASYAADLGLSNEKVAEILGKKDKPHLGFHRG